MEYGWEFAGEVTITDTKLMIEGCHSIIQKYQRILRTAENPDREAIQERLDLYYAKLEELRTI